MLPKEVFLSHSSKDRLFASKVAKQIRGHGIPVWYSETNIVGAQQWHDEIGEALKRCNWFVLILSPYSVKSTWVKNELIFALDHHRYKRKIVPLLYRNRKYERLSWTLPGFQIVDFRQSVDDGYRELLRVWGLVYKRKRAGARKASKKKR
jgi:TIR domain